MPLTPMRLVLLGAGGVGAGAQGRARRRPTANGARPDAPNEPSRVRQRARVRAALPEPTTYRVELPAGLQRRRRPAARQRERAALTVKTAPFPPLAKFAARFGILESQRRPGAAGDHPQPRARHARARSCGRRANAPASWRAEAAATSTRASPARSTACRTEQPEHDPAVAAPPRHGAPQPTSIFGDADAARRHGAADVHAAAAGRRRRRCRSSASRSTAPASTSSSSPARASARRCSESGEPMYVPPARWSPTSRCTSSGRARTRWSG